MEVFRELSNVVLEENGEDKMITERRGLWMYRKEEVDSKQVPV